MTLRIRIFWIRVAERRCVKKTTADIEPVAQGRVWLGDQAKDKGLVDELGGIDAAVAKARQLAGIPASSRVGLVLYPAKKSLWELIMETAGGMMRGASGCRT